MATQHSLVPVINAGDGGHNHPTQTVTDLITIHKEKGHFDNLTIGFCGDLKFGRTVHSLVAAMSRYTGVRFVFVSPEELKLPRYVKEQYVKSKNIPYTQSTSLEEVMPELDILYMTRVQKERFFNEEDYLRLKDSYILTPEKLENAKEDLRILHPLPRVNEISVAVDEDPRACYFKQAQNGRYIRKERYAGACSRSFYVGEDITEEDIKAEFKHGLLKLFVPKKEAKPAVETKKYVTIEG